jgi:hypothetical protein
MIYNLIKFIFTALFWIISFFVCGLYKKCCKKEEEEEEGQVETGKKTAAKKKTAQGP